MVSALEAFFESGPQIIHQLFIVCATKEISATQAISITISLLMLAKTTVMYDMMYNENGTGKRSISQTIKYLLAILPLYISSVVFKAGSISIFFMFFGFYAIVGLGMIWLVLLFVTFNMGFTLSDGMILSLTNLTVVSPHSSTTIFYCANLTLPPRFVLAPASPSTQCLTQGSNSSSEVRCSLWWYSQ